MMWFAVAFTGEPVGLDRAAPWRWRGTVPGARAGFSLATGDCNGDGIDDLAVGAPGEVGSGAVYLFYGAKDGLGVAPDAAVDGEEGVAVALVDVNADGHDDLVVGSSGRTENQAGRVSLYPCSAAGPALSPTWQASGPEPASRLGASVVEAGDFDGDGFDDVAVTDRNGFLRAGDGLRVYLGSADGLRSDRYWSPAWDAADPSAPNGRVLGVAAGHDVTADGLPDLAASVGHTVLLFAGRAGGPSPVEVASYEGPAGHAEFGERLLLGPDLDGDGHGELVVYDRGRRAGRRGEWGRVWVYAGSPGGPGTTVDKVARTSPSPAQGMASGDINADGFGDLLMGSGRANGRSRVLGVLGGPEQLTREGWGAWNELAVVQAENALGHALATGDLNGDGLVDLVAGDPLAPLHGLPTDPTAGAVYAWFGARAPGPAAPGPLGASDPAADEVLPGGAACGCAAAGGPPGWALGVVLGSWWWRRGRGGRGHAVAAGGRGAQAAREVAPQGR